MEIVASPLDWTSVDAENLAKFLDTETGKRFIPQLAGGTPTLLPKGDVNEILIRSGEVRGVQETIRLVLELAHPTAPVESAGQAYPPLDADKLWNDGQTLTPPEQKPE